jgi:tetratricopeptide (TPR) repeat protein
MPKISLRAYNRDIESLIDRGQTDQAIAHCKYILKQYPKHIQTYRLLGKTYLESQRYTEASDIFQRVLAVIPDDFIAHLGMSIIREDEGDLDAAIWHMERAFEVQPSNNAVQDELRRLYGRRDGIEPPRVRLTRGALVRMYARGELFPQAIAEARAALAEDSSRIDVEALMARVYYLSGRKVEATEISSRLVSKMPYCLEANRILAEVLPGTTRAEDAKSFQQATIALDPYYAFISKTTPQSDDVPENAVMVEQLDYDSSVVESRQPDWAQTIGADLYEDGQQAAPEWMETTKPPAREKNEPGTSSPESTEKTEPQKSPPSQPQDGDTPAEKANDIPSWMTAAGWETATGPEVNVPIEDESSDSLDANDSSNLAPADMPDWLKSLAPEPEGEPEPGNDQERLDVLNSILPPLGKDAEAQKSGSDQPQQASESEPPTPVSEAPVESPAAHEEENAPEWLSGLGFQPGLSEVQPTGPNNAVLEETTKIEPLPSELPAQSSGVDPSIGANDLDAAMAWLEGLAARQGADEETLFVPPEQRLDTQPEWIRDEGAVKGQETPDEPETPIKPPIDEASATAEPAASELPQPAFQTTDNSQPSMDEHAHNQQAEGNQMPQPVDEAPQIQPNADQDIDAAMAWLESLAARQGADESAFTVAPEKRVDTPPDWIRRELNVESSLDQTQAVQPVEGEPGVETQPVQIFKTQPSDSEKTIPVEPLAAPLDEVPASLEKTAPIQPVSLQETPLPSEENPREPDLDFAWLESLAARQGASEEELLTQPEERSETPPAWITDPEATVPVLTLPEKPETGDEEIPDWLSDLVSEETETSDSLSGLSHSPSEVSATQPEAAPWVEETDVPASENHGMQLVQSVELEPSVSAEIPVESEPDPLSQKQEAPQLEKGEEKQPETDLPEWLKNLEMDHVVEETTVTIEPADQPQAYDALLETTTAQNEQSGENSEALPAWLQELEKENEEPAPGLELPVEVVTYTEPATTLEPAQKEQTAAALPPDSDATEPESDGRVKLPEQEPDIALVEAASVEAPAPFELEPEPANATGPVEDQAISVSLQTNAPTAELSAEDISADTRGAYYAGRYYLENGQIEPALKIFTQLVEKDKVLDEIISDLRAALYRHPVDVSLWQALGDAYLRNNRIQEALDSYTKAEELLR